MIKTIRKNLGDGTYLEGYLLTLENIEFIYEVIKNTLPPDSYHIYEYVNMISNSNYEKIAFLEQVIVEKNKRGKGLGTQLVSEFINDVKDASCIFLFAPINAHQVTGISLLDFYEKHGFYLINPPRIDKDSLSVMELLSKKT